MDDTMTSTDEADLGFAYHARKNGDVEILREGRLVTLLRDKEAQTLLARIAQADFPAGQQMMARVTGNYKRGNERTARGTRATNRTNG
jgi:hypothetical protein